MVKGRWCDQTERLGSLQPSSLVLVSRLHSEASPYSWRCNVRLRPYRGGGARLSSLFSTWRAQQRSKNMGKSVDHSTGCVIYILFNNIHMPHSTQKQENYEKILETGLAVLYPIPPGAVLRDTATRTSYDAFADVVRVRCGGVLNAPLRVERSNRRPNKRHEPQMGKQTKLWWGQVTPGSSTRDGVCIWRKGEACCPPSFMGS